MWIYGFQKNIEVIFTLNVHSMVISQIDIAQGRRKEWEYGEMKNWSRREATTTIFHTASHNKVDVCILYWAVCKHLCLRKWRTN